MRTLFLVASVIALVVSCTQSLRAEDKAGPRKPSFPFDLIEGAAQVTTSLVILPFDIAYKAAPSAGGQGRRYTQDDLDWKQREYAQLNWYDDIRRGYTQAHERKEADEELYQMRRR